MGQFIPPMILFKGQRLKPEWEENLPQGTKVVMAPKGSMTCEVFTQWIHHFAKYRVTGDRALLIFDGASSHLDVNIVSAAEEHNITLFCLPSNTTHELQPLDKSVFKSFESFWDDEVLKYWMTHPDRKINRSIFGKIFSEVWQRSMTSVNLVSGFKSTGIYPYNPDIIPEVAFAPSSTTEANIDISSTGEHATTSSRDSIEQKRLKTQAVPVNTYDSGVEANPSTALIPNPQPSNCPARTPEAVLKEYESPKSIPDFGLQNESVSSSRTLSQILSTPKKKCKTDSASPSNQFTCAEDCKISFPKKKIFSCNKGLTRQNLQRKKKECFNFSELSTTGPKWNSAEG